MEPAQSIVVGRVGVDLYPLQSGVGLQDVESFGKFVGGSAGNVAIAAARHGHDVALFSRTGDDPFGQYVRRTLEQLGVGSVLLGTDPQMPTPITFCEIFPPDDFPLYFYRYPQAPDLRIEPADVDASAVQRAPLLWTTLTGMSQEPSRSAHEALFTARARRRHTVVDLDYRPMFWADEGAARAAAEVSIAASTVAIGNSEECRVAVGESDPERAAHALLERGVQLAVVKQGPKGVLAVTRDERVECPPVPVRVVNGLGAGDAFGGAFIHGLLSEWGLERTVRFANTAGAIVAGRLECSTAMPTTAEVEQHMMNPSTTSGEAPHE